MKRLVLVAALASLAGATGALAQPASPAPYSPAPAPQASPNPPAGPQLDATQAAEVKRQLDPYRSEVDGRIARGEITSEEAGRLLHWREWQITQQVAGLGPPPGPIVEEVPAPARDYSSRPYYTPYYPAPYSPAPYYSAPYYPAPYYYGPAYYGGAPYYWGARVCAGGFGHHFGARFCF